MKRKFVYYRKSNRPNIFKNKSLRDAREIGMGSGKGVRVRIFIVCTVTLLQSVMIKSRISQWTGNARMEKDGMVSKF